MSASHFLAPRKRNEFLFNGEVLDRVSWYGSFVTFFLLSFGPSSCLSYLGKAFIIPLEQKFINTNLEHQSFFKIVYKKIKNIIFLTSVLLSSVCQCEQYLNSTFGATMLSSLPRLELISTLPTNQNTEFTIASPFLNGF